MRSSRIVSFFVLALVCVLPAQMAFGQFSGGSGTVGDPWQIANWQDLTDVDDVESYYDDHFILTANINWGDTGTNFPLFPRFNQGGREDGIPASGGATTFGGVFDGNGYVISNSTRCFFDGGRPPYGGTAGVVKNLILTNINVVCTYHVYDNVSKGHGALYCTGNNNVPAMRFINCHASGAISNNNSSYPTGGLFGSAYRVFASNCTANVRVYSAGAAGGFAGSYSTGSTSIHCRAYGEVTGNGNNAGGFVGSVGGGLIYQCVATGRVNQTGGYYSGGFVGLINGAGTIRECYATGDVDNDGSNGEAGGFCGATVSGTGNTFIEDCYAIGDVIGTLYNSNRTGGFMGEYGRFGTGHLITRCYSSGDQSSTAGGGFSGQNSTGGSIISNCYATVSTCDNSSAGFSSGGAVTIGNCYWTNSATSDSYATKVAGAEYFYDENNPPFQTWDSANVWYFSGDADPVLRWDTEIIVAPDGMKILVR